MSDTKHLSLAELRPKLTDVIRDVGAGQTFVITRYGDPIATIGPVTSASNTQADQHLAVSPQLRPEPKVNPTRNQSGVDQLLGKINSRSKRGGT